MSEELIDEVEAINSIYGEGSLILSEDAGGETSVYILSLPSDTSSSSSSSSSLRLQFPPTYPDVPPMVLGTHSSGEQTRRRGAAARDLSLFRDAVADVYLPGQVCLFDAVEKFRELLAGEGAEEGEEEEEKMDGAEGGGDHPQAGLSEEGSATQLGPGKGNGNGSAGVPPEALTPEPPWILSAPVTEQRSTFLARCARVTSPSEASLFVQHLLATDKRARSATHNMTAWRIRGPGGSSFQDCDDDGETAAGGRLLHLMQVMDLWDVMVVVTRWYGGLKLGPRRFALINGVARDAFVRAGLVGETATGGGKKKKAG